MPCPDNYDLFIKHDRRQQQWLDSRPVCDYCDNPIQDDFAYQINGDILCEGCLNDHFRISTDDLQGVND